MPRSGPLQNRVLPTGQIVATPHRGQFMGNRGGRIHDPKSKTLLSNRAAASSKNSKLWASRRWICCKTEFKNRQRQVMGSGYTELFFLDEVTALAAGHRPCFECRREAAQNFRDALTESEIIPTGGNGLGADDIDRQLHRERWISRKGPKERITDWRDLPDGTMLEADGNLVAVYENTLLLWSLEGYRPAEGKLKGHEPMTLITPRSVLQVFRAGYRPAWHHSLETF